MPNPGEGHLFYARPPGYRGRVWDGQESTLQAFQLYVNQGVLQFNPDNGELRLWGSTLIEPGVWIIDRDGWVDVIAQAEFEQAYQPDSPIDYTSTPEPAPEPAPEPGAVEGEPAGETTT